MRKCSSTEAHGWSFLNKNFHCLRMLIESRQMAIGGMQTSFPLEYASKIMTLIADNANVVDNLNKCFLLYALSRISQRLNVRKTADEHRFLTALIERRMRATKNK